MKELHITVPVSNEAVAEAIVDHVAHEAAAFDVGTFSYHIHEPEPAPKGGEIVGWQVVSAPSVRDFHEHGEAAVYASKTGGDLYPIYDEEA